MLTILRSPNKSVCVQPPASAVDVTLPAFAAERRAASIRLVQFCAKPVIDRSLCSDKTVDAVKCLCPKNTTLRTYDHCSAVCVVCIKDNV